MINLATRMNAFTLRDAGSPPGADQFAEDFVMC